MSKIRVISDIPVMDESGNVLHIRELAGPADEISAMDTSDLANGTLAFVSDSGVIKPFDEDDGWGEGV